MPFTASHPAAVLPLLRLGLPASALVVGSVVPDLLYFAPFLPSPPTHTAASIVTVDLALGLALWLVWQAVLAPAAVTAAPPSLRERVLRLAAPGVRARLSRLSDGLRVAVGVVLGASTHVGWDEFTHGGRWGARHVPALAESWAGIPGWHWAQGFSGLLGAAVLLWWGRRWWRATAPAPVVPVDRVVPLVPRSAGPSVAGDRAWYWPWLLLGVVGAVVGSAYAVRAEDLESTAYLAVTRGGGAAGGTALLVSLLAALRSRRRLGPGVGHRGGTT